MKLPRIPILLPLAATIAASIILGYGGYTAILRAIEDSSTARKKPHVQLIKRAFLAPSVVDVAEVKQRSLISGTIEHVQPQTYIRIGRRRPDGKYTPIVDNRDDPRHSTSKGAIAAAVELLDSNDPAITAQGIDFSFDGQDYHLISALFPLSKTESDGFAYPSGRIILITNVDLATRGLREILAVTGLQILAFVGLATTASVLIVTYPIGRIDRQIKRGQPIKAAWWVSKPIANLAETLEQGRQSEATFRTETARNVEQLTMARSDAERLAQEIETVNHIAVHDIKADLTALNLGSELIQETIAELTEYIEGRSDGVINEALDTIKHFSGLNVKSASNAFDVLDQRNKLYDLESKIDIRDCSIESILDSLSAAFSAEPGELRIYSECPENRRIWADESLLTTVLKNIVRNGFLHNDSALKRVEVKVAPIGHRTRIEISDNGVGMPPHYLENWGSVLGKAAQLSTERGGSGTGLYSIRAIVMAHKGASINITSAVGEGTVFTLEFDHVS